MIMPKLQDVLTSATLILKEKLILIQESNLYDRENSLSVKVKFEVRELILELKYFNNLIFKYYFKILSYIYI